MSEATLPAPEVKKEFVVPETPAILFEGGGKPEVDIISSVRMLQTILKHEPVARSLSSVASNPDSVAAAIFDAAESCRKNPALLFCKSMSILVAIKESLRMRLSIDGVLGQSYLVPYGQDAKLMPGYQGLLTLAWRTGKVAGVDAQAVYEGDTFQYEFGTNPNIIHIPAQDPEGDQDRTTRSIIAYYAWVKLDTGMLNCGVMTREDAVRHMKKYAKGYKNATSAWQTNPVWMSKKSVLKQALKLVPFDSDARLLLQRDEYIEAGVLPSPNDVPEGLKSGDDVATDTLDGVVDELSETCEG